MSEPLRIEQRRTCLIYSSGGHLTELLRAIDGIEFPNSYHVTFKSGRTTDRENLYFITHPRRSIWRTFFNAIQSLLLILRQRPQLVISTGADVAVPTMILAWVLGARTIFIETSGTLTPSLAGRLVYPFCSLFVVQWPQKKRFFPKARLATGPLL